MQLQFETITCFGIFLGAQLLLVFFASTRGEFVIGCGPRDVIQVFLPTPTVHIGRLQLPLPS